MAADAKLPCTNELVSLRRQDYLFVFGSALSERERRQNSMTSSLYEHVVYRSGGTSDVHRNGGTSDVHCIHRKMRCLGVHTRFRQ